MISIIVLSILLCVFIILDFGNDILDLASMDDFWNFNVLGSIRFGWVLENLTTRNPLVNDFALIS